MIFRTSYRLCDQRLSITAYSPSFGLMLAIGVFLCGHIIRRGDDVWLSREKPHKLAQVDRPIGP
jgi:hypothetical protein